MMDIKLEEVGFTIQNFQKVKNKKKGKKNLKNSKFSKIQNFQKYKIFKKKTFQSYNFLISKNFTFQCKLNII